LPWWVCRGGQGNIAWPSAQSCLWCRHLWPGVGRFLRAGPGTPRRPGRSGSRPARHPGPGFALIRERLAAGAAAKVPRRWVLWDRVGQGVQQGVAGPEVGRGGPDPLARDEFEGGGGGRPAVDVEPHR
jgi:hypothetical protein